MALLEVRNLGISFGGLRAVDDLNMNIEEFCSLSLSRAREFSTIMDRERGEHTLVD